MTAAVTARSPRGPAEKVRSSMFRVPADRRALTLLVVVGVVVPAVASAALGSFGLPSLDDWSYRRVAADFAATGHLHYGGWVSMTFVGQALWAWPFVKVLGPHGWVFDASTWILSAVCIGSCYFLARQVMRRSLSVAAVVLLLTAPGVLLNTSTFMTDVPALSAEMLSLALGMAGLRKVGRERAAFIAGCVAAGMFGFTIREFDLVAPVVVLACAARAAKGRARWAYVATTVVVLIVSAAIYQWSTGIPGMWKLSLGLPTRGSFLRLVRAYLLVALCSAPALAWRFRAARVRRPLPGAVAAAAVLVLGLVADRGPGIWVGNNVEPRGAGGNLLLAGDRPVLIGPALWHLVTAVAVASGMALAFVAVGTLVPARLVRRRQWADPMVVFETFSSALMIGFAVYVLLSPKIFDRYFWAPTFAVVVLLLAGSRRSPSGPVRGWAVVTAASSILLGVVALSTTVNSDAYDAARWRAGDFAVSRGVAPATVDAGFEWVGAHSSGSVDLALQESPLPAYEQWYARMEPGFRDCAVVSGSQLVDPHLRMMGERRYRALAVAEPAHLYIYRVVAPGC